MSSETAPTTVVSASQPEETDTEGVQDVCEL